MSDLERRERGFEAKFALDEEVQFKIMARRNRLLGEWAGAILGKAGPELAEYAAQVVAADFAEVGDEDVLRKVAADLKAAGQSYDDLHIRHKMQELFAAAKAQILG
jgi:hypothetical protein